MSMKLKTTQISGSLNSICLQQAIQPEPASYSALLEYTYTLPNLIVNKLFKCFMYKF